VRERRHNRGRRLAGKVMTTVHVAVYRGTGRRVGRQWLGSDVGFVTTTGRRSGRRRVAPLVCIRDGSALAVVASNGGSDRAPDWWLNLQHEPRAELELGGARHLVWATRADSEAEARVLSRFADEFPHFERYRQRTEREIPVVLLRMR
jgi:deazaflavin-dependent oxidoreductase (nitroreductase family)